MLRRPSSSLYVRSQYSNVFFYETTWPFRVKLHIEHPLEGGTKFCINGQDHMTKMATIPIYDKNLYKASSPEPGVCNLKLGMQHSGFKLYKAGINDYVGHGQNWSPENLNGKTITNEIKLEYCK